MATPYRGGANSGVRELRKLLRRLPVPSDPSPLCGSRSGASMRARHSHIRVQQRVRVRSSSSARRHKGIAVRSALRCEPSPNPLPGGRGGGRCEHLTPTLSLQVEGAGGASEIVRHHHPRLFTIHKSLLRVIPVEPFRPGLAVVARFEEVLPHTAVSRQGRPFTAQ